MRFWLLLGLANSALGLGTGIVAALILHWHPLLVGLLAAIPLLAANTTAIDHHQRHAQPGGTMPEHAPSDADLIFIDPVCAQDMGNAFAWWDPSPRHARRCPRTRHRRRR